MERRPCFRHTAARYAGTKDRAKTATAHPRSTNCNATSLREGGAVAGDTTISATTAAMLSAPMIRVKLRGAHGTDAGGVSFADLRSMSGSMEVPSRSLGHTGPSRRGGLVGL